MHRANPLTATERASGSRSRLSMRGLLGWGKEAHRPKRGTATNLLEQPLAATKENEHRTPNAKHRCGGASIEFTPQSGASNGGIVLGRCDLVVGDLWTFDAQDPVQKTGSCVVVIRRGRDLEGPPRQRLAPLWPGAGSPARRGPRGSRSRGGLGPGPREASTKESKSAVVPERHRPETFGTKRQSGAGCRAPHSKAAAAARNRRLPDQAGQPVRDRALWRGLGSGPL
jgi:hypothetical protein